MQKSVWKRSQVYPLLLLCALLCVSLLLAGCGSEQPLAPKSAESTAPPQVHDVKKDSGRYEGQIDNNSIEIKISGVPEEIAARAFQLSPEIKENFAGYGLKGGEQVLFSYRENAPGQPVLIEIQKITPTK